jgi:hypothetical protein
MKPFKSFKFRANKTLQAFLVLNEKNVIISSLIITQFEVQLSCINDQIAFYASYPFVGCRMLIKLQP